MLQRQARYAQIVRMNSNRCKTSKDSGYTILEGWHVCTEQVVRRTLVLWVHGCASSHLLNGQIWRDDFTLALLIRAAATTAAAAAAAAGLCRLSG